MKKQYGLMHIPDLTADETRLPAWYLAADVDARIAELENENRGLVNVIVDRENRICELQKALRNVMSDADRGFGMPDAVKQTIASL